MLIDELIEILKYKPEQKNCAKSIIDNIMQKFWSIGAEVCREIDDGLESIEPEAQTASE